ncbi:hypothetical protein B0H13DRAFT_2452399 [Mycena leptocephala]|nr:hypothetical protein B0H13DRAFT_2452399 [Mycena leptocephala]
MTTFPTQFLTWIGNWNPSQTLGLFNGTLYDVLQDVTLGTGEAKVMATGFNFTCGYPNTVINGVYYSSLSFLDISVGSYGSINITMPRMHLLIVNHQGLPVTLAKPTGSSSNIHISQVQFLECTKSLVDQSGTVDTEFRTLNGSSLEPNIFKTNSTWTASTSMSLGPQDSTLLGGDLWTEILTQSYYTDAMTVGTTVDDFLTGYLDIDPFSNLNDPQAVLNLHEIENALSALVATLFWTGEQIILLVNCGYIRPDTVTMRFAKRDTASLLQLYELSVPPELKAGNTTAYPRKLAVQLNISLTAFLAASVLTDSSVDSLGLLHMIWLCRDHPAHSKFLVDVKQPTKGNLRTAGSVAIQLSFQRSLNQRDGDLPIKEKDMVFHKTKPDAPRATASPTDSNSAGRLVLLSYTSTSYLRIFSVMLHIILVLGHLTLLGLLVGKLGPQIVFSVDLQNNVSFWITFAANALGTTYCSMILYLTQQLVIKTAGQKYYTLTSTHDKLSSLQGIGSSLSTLSRQIVLPASISATMSIFIYLSAISLLHVTTPALFAVATFDLLNSSVVDVQSIPEWNGSSYTTISYVQDLANFLPWLGNLDQSQTMGLSNGSLHDVLSNVYPGSRTVAVTAIGFNITCGYPSVNKTEWKGDDYNIYLDSLSGTSLEIPQLMGVDIIHLMDIIPLMDIGASIPPNTPALSSSIILYTPNIWAKIVQSLSTSDISLSQAWYFSWGDVYLMDQLGLVPHIGLDTSVASDHILYLHDIENALSNLVASIFWMGDIFSLEETNTDHHQAVPVLLTTKKTTILQSSSAARLEMSPWAVSLGLGASVVLLILTVILSSGACTGQSKKPSGCFSIILNYLKYLNKWRIPQITICVWLGWSRNSGQKAVERTILRCSCTPKPSSRNSGQNAVERTILRCSSTAKTTSGNSERNKSGEKNAASKHQIRQAKDEITKSGIKWPQSTVEGWDKLLERTKESHEHKFRVTGSRLAPCHNNFKSRRFDLKPTVNQSQGDGLPTESPDGRLQCGHLIWRPAQKRPQRRGALKPLQNSDTRTSNLIVNTGVRNFQRSGIAPEMRRVDKNLV